MGGEGGPQRPVMIVEPSHHALVIGVGVGLSLEHRCGPALGGALHRLGIPIGPLHQSYARRDDTARRPCGQCLEVVGSVAQIGLDHDAGVKSGQLRTLEEPPEQPVAQALGVVTLGVEPHRHASFATHAQDGEQPSFGLGHPLFAAQWVEGRRQRRDLDAHTRPGDPPDVVGLEQVVVGPCLCGDSQGLDQRRHPRRVAIGVGSAVGVLAEQVDGGGRVAPPQSGCGRGDLSRCRPDDELASHAVDAAPDHDRTHVRPAGHPFAEPQSPGEPGRDVHPGELGTQVLLGVLVPAKGREGVDEAEQPGPEYRIGHGVGQQAVAPPIEPEHSGPVAPAEIGDPAGQFDDLVLAPRRIGHDTDGTAVVVITPERHRPWSA